MTIEIRAEGVAGVPFHQTISAPSRRRSAYVLGFMLIVYTISYVDRTLVGVLAPLIKADLHLSDTELGFANGTAFATVYATLTIPSGWLADRFNRKVIIGGALALWSCFTALFGLGQSLTHLALARAGVGFGEAGGAAPTHSLLMDYFPPSQRARAMAIYGFGVPLGVACGAMIGGLASKELGWRTTFFLAGAFGLGLAILMKLTVREPIRVMQAGVHSTPEPFFKSVAIMLSKPAYVALAAGTGCGGITGFSRYFWISSYFVRSFGVSLSHVAFMMSFIEFFAGIGGAWIGGYLADRFARRDPGAHAWVTSLSYIAVVPMLIGVLVTENLHVAFMCYFGATFFSSFGNGPIVAATQHLATPVLRGTAAAILNFSIVMLGAGIGVPMVGALADALTPRFGVEALRYALFILPVFSLVGAALIAVCAGRMTIDAPVAAGNS